MKKLLILFAFVPFLVNAQTPDPLVDLSEYHDDNRLIEMTDLNFTNITEGGYTLPTIKVDLITFDNGATIDNEDADTLTLTETVVKVDGDLYVSGQILNCCSGALTYVSTPGTMTINTGGTYEKIDEGNIAYTADHLNNFTHADGRLTYIGANTLHFTIMCSVSVESGETAQIIQFRLAKNGTTIAGTNMTREFSATATDSAIPLNWLDTFDTDDYIEVYGTSDTNADEFDINNLVLTVVKH